MNEEEFYDYLGECFSKCEDKQERLLEKYKLEKYPFYEWNEDSGTIKFYKKGGESAVFNMIFIGSWSHSTETWMWAWGNEELTAKSRKRSEKLKELAETTGYKQFEIDIIEAAEEMTYELVSVAVEHLGAEGFYSLKGEGNYIYIALINPV